MRHAPGLSRRRQRSTNRPLPRTADGSGLLVEDDADVRASTSATLGELGYEIVEVASGEAALEVLDGGRPVALVFTEVIMASGVSGIADRRAWPFRSALE